MSASFFYFFFSLFVSALVGEASGVRFSGISLIPSLDGYTCSHRCLFFPLNQGRAILCSSSYISQAHLPQFVKLLLSTEDVITTGTSRHATD